jgi:hypothetical protein
MPYNPNKTISANSKGIVIFLGDSSKSRYVPYKSKELADIQLFGKAQYQDFDKPVFNRTQQKLYGEVLYGVKAYNESEIMALPRKEVLRITSVHKRVHFFLNRWKQEIMDDRVSTLLSKLFPKSSTATAMSSIKGYNRAYTAKYTFKELGLTQENVARKLVEMGFLPENFFQLA